MINAFLLSSRCPRAAQGLLFALAFFAAASTGAQNYVQNPDFNQPLGPTNWTVKYVGGTTAADFWIQGRTTLANRDAVPGTWDGSSYFDPFYPGGPSGFGGHFRPYHDELAHAYLDQVVSGLTPNAQYVVTAWMAQLQSGYVSYAKVYLATLNGPSLNLSNSTAFAYNYVFNNPNGWASYAVVSTASTNGQIDVQLHYYKSAENGINNIWLNLDGFYDHVSVMPVIPPPQQPQILSLGLTNQTVSLNWSTFMNNTYDIEVSPDLATWSEFQTNLYAYGTNLTYTRDLASVPSTPQFFRVVSHNYVP